jgi:hypothetical protein
VHKHLYSGGTVLCDELDRFMCCQVYWAPALLQAGPLSKTVRTKSCYAGHNHFEINFVEEAQDLAAKEKPTYPTFRIHREKTELRKCAACRDIIEQPDFRSQMPAFLDLLNPGKWLNSSIVDRYCRSLFRDNEELNGNHVLLLESSESERILVDGNQSNKNYPRNLLQKDNETVVYCPICIRNSHWILVVLKSSGKSICLYDPCGDPCARTLQILQLFLGVHGHFWTVEEPTFHIRHRQPRNNECDSGVYVCMYIAYLVRGQTFDFTQSDVLMLRKWIAYCLSGRSDPIARDVAPPLTRPPLNKRGRKMIFVEPDVQSRSRGQTRAVGAAEKEAPAARVAESEPHPHRPVPAVESRKTFAGISWSRSLKMKAHNSSHWFTTNSNVQPFNPGTLHQASSSVSPRPVVRGSHTREKSESYAAEKLLRVGNVGTTYLKRHSKDCSVPEP